jgi:integrase/recombinase XerD
MGRGKFDRHSPYDLVDDSQALVRAKRVVVPSSQQLQRLLELPDTTTDKGLRDRAVLELLYATGMRAAEILSIKLHQLVKDRCLRIMGKGQVERLVVYGEEAAYWIAQYKAKRQSMLQAAGHGLVSTSNSS